jgi:exopolysaccharide production protein ExoZ
MKNINYLPKEFKSLQILRFIASTSVVYLHCYSEPNFGEFGVDIFFILSGFVIALVIHTKQTATFFAISRFSRIAPLYWLLTTLLFLLIVISPQLVHNTTSDSANVQNYIKSLLFIPYFGASDMKPLLRVGWTLNYEMFFYFSVWLSIIIFRKRILIYTSIFLVASYFILGGIENSRVLHNFFKSEMIFEFILGMAAFKIYIKGYFSLIPNYCLISIAFACYLLMIYFELHDYTENKFIYFGMPSFILVLFIVHIEKLFKNSKTSNLTKILVEMGNASYSTYLTHWFIIVAFRKIINEKYGLLEPYTPFNTLAMILLSLFIGQLVYLMIDKPLHDLVKKLFLSIKILRH